jgi:hypothetical protein
MLKEIISIIIAIVVGFLLIQFGLFLLGAFIKLTFGILFLVLVAIAAVPVYLLVKKLLLK